MTDIQYLPQSCNKKCLFAKQQHYLYNTSKSQ